MIVRPRSKIISIALVAASAILSSCSSRGVDEDNDNTPYGYDGYDIVPTDSVYAYRKSSPYASVLKDCIVINTVAESCAVSKLPFIGDGTTQPTINDVMDRVLVTHNWMGARFEEVLRSAPPEVMTLFSSATAVLLGSEVRPSYYTTLNGAIQIDPGYLWATVEEKASVSKQEDFRSGFGADLQFWFLRSTVDRSGNRKTPYYSLDDDSERPIEDVILPLVRLLVHELAHATDFMPRSRISQINTSLSVYDAIDSIADQWLSPQLSAAHPLTSLEMQGFAGVNYRGLEATDQQKATTADDVGEYMASDGAIKFYSYTTIREDLAQLVEAVVMSSRYDALANVGFTQKPADEDNYTCADLRVAWGQRNRLADPLVNVRARAATDLVLSLSPEMIDYLDNTLGSTESMERNVGWCENQRPDTVVAAASSTRSSNSSKSPQAGPLFMEMMEADSVGHPDSMHKE